MPPQFGAVSNVAIDRRQSTQMGGKLLEAGCAPCQSVNVNERSKLGGEKGCLNVWKWVWPEAVGQSAFAHLRSFRLTRYVSEMALHPDVARLAETLEAMTTLLKLHCDNGWAEQVERCRSSIAQSDYHGVDRLLCLYGGMGSLNDVILQSGGVAPVEDNERFDALRTAAWKQANALA